MSDITNYENLANAIVLQAVKDYRMGVKSLKANPRNRTAMADKEEIERFFRGGWCSVITRLQGDWLIRPCKWRWTHDRKRISEPGAAPGRTHQLPPT